MVEGSLRGSTLTYGGPEIGVTVAPAGCRTTCRAESDNKDKGYFFSIQAKRAKRKLLK